jgi:phage/plasmid-like protein (TIGR03299 family)
MSHNIETMAYAGETPWHSLGVKVDSTLSPQQIAVAAGCDWEAIKVPVYAHMGKPFTKGFKAVPTGEFAIVRDSDFKVLSPSVGEGWQPVSNSEVFATFDDIVRAGNATMETAGSLQGGRIIWALAKLNSEFTVGDTDKTLGYMFLSASHRWGMATRCDFTSIRIVCNNTLNAALSDKSAGALTIQHRTKFDASRVADFMGVSESQMNHRKAQAMALLATKAKDDDLKAFYAMVFPLTSKSNLREKELSRNAELALAMNADRAQPGNDESFGTWWSAFNTVTYMTDHVLANTPETRMFNSWLGTGRKLKLEAMNSALKFAGASSDLAETIAA